MLIPFYGNGGNKLTKIRNYKKYILDLDIYTDKLEVKYPRSNGKKNNKR